jgi:hypothetical protein
MKTPKLLFLTAAVLLFSGCASTPETTTTGDAWNEDWTQIGTNMELEVPKKLTLLDNKEALAADGLYYATWVDGDSVPYENSDGETVDLYDAQLYLLVNECDSQDDAEKSCATWLAAAKDNYDVLSEKEIVCNGQTYTLLSYNCIGEDNPYDHGVSAFGTNDLESVCAEFTCLETCEEDLETLLTDFLNGCHYGAR